LNELHEALDDLFSVEIVVHGLEPPEEFENVFHGEDIELRIIVKEDVLQAVDDPLVELMEARSLTLGNKVHKCSELRPGNVFLLLS
jgi:hypothetical protein